MCFALPSPPSQRANRLIALPPELGNMQQLKELLVAENPLGTIPLGIDRNSTVELKNYLCVVVLPFERPIAIAIVIVSQVVVSFVPESVLAR